MSNSIKKPSSNSSFYHAIWSMLPLTLIIFSFQNCSVYESEGRKTFNEKGLELLTSSVSEDSNSNNNANNSLGKLVQPNNCSPYLETSDINNILDSKNSLSSLYHDEESKQKSCIISDSTICTIKNDRLDLSALTSDTSIIDDPHNDGPLDAGSFAFISLKNKNSSPELHFVGSKLHTRQSIHCKYKFKNIKEYEQNLPSLLKQQSKLVHLISKQL